MSIKQLKIYVECVLAALVGTYASNADAQPWQCGTTSSTCFSGAVNASGAIEADFGSTSGIAVFGGDTSSGQGVLGVSDTGIGVAAVTNFPNGSAWSWPSGSYGVYGSASKTPPSDTGTYGVFGYAPSSSQYGVYGLSTNGNGVVGSSGASVNSGVAGLNTGGGHGVYGSSTSPGGYGVYGTGYDFGVYGTSAQSVGSGVKGNNTNGGIGVYGTCSGSGCYAGWFNAQVYINGTTYGSSDERLKKNINPLSGSLDKLLQLKGVTFEWKEPEKHSNETGTRIGFIAQEVEKVFPSWVHDGPDGFKVLGVSQVEALEVESIRDLKGQVDALKSEVRELKESRRPVAAMNSSGLGFGVAGIAIAGAIVSARRRRDD